MSATSAPEQIFLWDDGRQKEGETLAVIMQGTFRWELEFIALTGGSYQAACEGMGEQLDEFYRCGKLQERLDKATERYRENPTEVNLEILSRAKEQHREPKIINPDFAQVCFDLAFSACAKWRRESGWNKNNSEDGDENRPPKERGPYLAFVDRLRRPDAVRLQCAVTSLLYAYNFDPGPAAEKKSEATLRPESDAPPENSTTA